VNVQQLSPQKMVCVEHVSDGTLANATNPKIVAAIKKTPTRLKIFFFITVNFS